MSPDDLRKLWESSPDAEGSPTPGPRPPRRYWLPRAVSSLGAAAVNVGCSCLLATLVLVPVLAWAIIRLVLHFT